MSIIEFVDYGLNWLLYLVLPFTTCISAILLLQKIALRIGIVDKPDDRKHHLGDIPLVGGSAIFIAFATSLTLLTTELSFYPLLLLGLLLLVTGLVDDVIDLSPYLKIIVEAVAAVGMIYLGENIITSTGNTIGFGSVSYPFLIAVPFTVICCIGVINSINMIDGMDGLAGSLLSISFAAMLFMFWHEDHHELAQITLMLIGSLIAFLCFNARIFTTSASIFLGDSGSMFLGFTFSWLLIMGSQSPVDAISPVAAGWLFGLPLIDTISVTVARIQKGNSPFKAGRDHLHHLLIDSGYSTKQTLLIMSAAQLLLVCGALIISLNSNLEPVGFWVFLLLIVAYHFMVKSRIASTILKNTIITSNSPENPKKLLHPDSRNG